MPECLPPFHLLGFFVLFSSSLLHPSPSSLIDRLNDDDDVVTMETGLQSRRTRSEDTALLD